MSGPTSILGRLIHHLTDPGWIGVQLFFVLSGFLITGALLDTRGAANYFGVFFARRVLRIFPLYYAALLVAFVLLPLLFPAHAPDGRGQIWLWTYLVNWTHAGGGPAFPHFWSLAVEEQFYLLWPFVVRAVAPSRLFRLGIGLAVAAFVARVALRAAGADVELVYRWTICRIDALAGGAALAVWLRLPGGPELVERRWRGLSVATALIAAATVVVTKGLARTSLPTQTLGYSLLVWIFTYLVLAAVRAEVRLATDKPGAANGAATRLLGARALRSVGKYSYAMYVFHLPIHALLAPLATKWWGGGPIVGARALIYMVVASCATYLAAMASYHLFEARLLALKRHFRPRSAPSPSPSEPSPVSELA